MISRFRWCSLHPTMTHHQSDKCASVLEDVIQGNFLCCVILRKFHAKESPITTATPSSNYSSTYNTYPVPEGLYLWNKRIADGANRATSNNHNSLENSAGHHRSLKLLANRNNTSPCLPKFWSDITIDHRHEPTSDGRLIRSVQK